MWTTETELIVKIENHWIRVSAVDAVLAPALNGHPPVVLLRSGKSITFHGSKLTSDQIVKRLFIKDGET